MRAQSAKRQGRRVKSPEDLDEFYFQARDPRYYKCPLRWKSGPIDPGIAQPRKHHIGIRGHAAVLFQFYLTNLVVAPNQDDEKEAWGRSVEDFVRRLRVLNKRAVDLSWPHGKTDEIIQLFHMSRAINGLDKDRARQVVLAASDFVADILCLPSDQMSEIVSDDYFSPSDMMKRLVELKRTQETQAQFNVELFSYFDGDFQGSEHVGNTKADQALNGLYASMSVDENAPHILGLIGPRFSGKTPLLIALLRTLGVDPTASGEDRSQYYRREGSATVLPVFAKNCNYLSFPELLDSVLQFLRSATSDRARPRVRSVEEKLALINQLAADRPALFVFANLDYFSEESITLSVKRGGVKRLLDILTQTARDTRIVFSSQSSFETVLKQTDAARAALVREFVVPSQTLLDFKTLHTGKSHDVAVQLLHPLDEDVNVSGQTLCLFSAAIALQLPKERISEVIVALRSGRDVGASRDQNLGEPTQGEIEAERICWHHILQQLGVENPIIWILALTAASFDGLSVSSIKETVQQLEMLNFVSEVNKPIWLIETLISATDRRLIFEMENNSLASYERAASEKPIFVPDHRRRKERRYVMDPPMAQSLTRYLFEQEPILFRMTRTIISIRARERSDLTKLQIRWIYGTSKHHYRRDIQAYSNLIASLDPDDIEPYAPRETETANILDSEAFSLPRLPSGAELIRYAYYRVLRKDIDRANRMSMVLDDDRVRLQLYLQLFHAGELFDYDNEGALTLPDKIPTYLRNAFSKNEIAKMLVTVGIAAFFANRYDILQKASELADKMINRVAKAGFINENERADLISNFMRLWCTELDALFLDCRDSKTYEASWVVLTLRLKELKQRCSAISIPGLRDLAVQRLRFHEARLAYWSMPEEVNALAYVDTCMNAAKTINRGSKSSAGALSGRNVRILIKILLGDPAFSQPELTTEELEARSERITKASSLNAHNIARLSRYSGGDRVACLIDAALIELSKLNYLSAHDFISQADDSIYYPNLSFSLKLDLLWHRAQISYVIAKDADVSVFEATGWDKSDFYRTAHHAARAVLHLSRGQFPLFSARATLLLSMISEYSNEDAPEDVALNGAVTTLVHLNSPLAAFARSRVSPGIE